MLTEDFLRGRRNESLTVAERERLERAVSEVIALEPRTTFVHIGQPLTKSALLIEGFMCRYIDDRRGLRQLVAIQVPGDFVDLHGYPLKELEHDIATLSAARVAMVPHDALDGLIVDDPAFARKIWYSTLLDAALHRAWLFRLGRLDALGRVAHLLCELDARLAAVRRSDGRHYRLGITQADLAEACGLTTVHVNRVLRQLREQGLATFRGQQVTILDRPRLIDRAQFDPTYLYLAD